MIGNKAGPAALWWEDRQADGSMTPPHPDRDKEIARLFAELREVYARAREGVTAPATTQVSLHVREEAAKAAEIIRRIRAIQDL
jgi:hypothetical protein